MICGVSEGDGINLTVSLANARSRTRWVLRVAIIVAVLAALALVETQTRSGALWRLITFTYQANVLAAGYYAWTLASPRADASSKR